MLCGEGLEEVTFYLSAPKEINRAFSSSTSGGGQVIHCSATAELTRRRPGVPEYCHISTCQIATPTESRKINYSLYIFWGIIDPGKLLTHNNVIQDFQNLTAAVRQLLMMLTSPILLDPTKGLKENHCLTS